MGPEGFVNVLAVEQVDGELEALSNEGGEEEEAEGDNLEDKDFLSNVVSGVAGGPVLEAFLAGSGEGQTYEDGDGEERVDVDKTVKGRNVDAGG